MEALLKVKDRAVRPRSNKKILRSEGEIPAIVYGNILKNSEPISVDFSEFMRQYVTNGENGVYYLEKDGETIPSLVRSVQKDTFTRKIYHIEFLAVNMKEEQEVEAELVLTGTPEGVKAGGILTQDLFVARVAAMPDKLPTTIEVDVTGLEIGQAINIGDLAVSSDYRLLTDGEEQIASVTEARIEPEETPEEVAE